MLVLDGLSLKGAAPDLSASGRFDPATRQVVATLDAEIASLQPVGKELGSKLAGRLAANGGRRAARSDPQAQVRLEGSNLAAGAATLDSLRLEAGIANPTQPQASITGDFRSGVSTAR